MSQAPSLGRDERSARRLYDVVAADYARLLPDVGTETAVERGLLAELVRRALGAGPVLDAGCGTGRVAAHLMSIGADVVGVDLSLGMLAESRHHHPVVPVVSGSMTRLPVRDGAVSAALSWYSVIHTAPDDLPCVIAELARVLAPGAPLLLAFQSGQGERVDSTTAYGHDVGRTSYRHRVDHVTDQLTHAGVSLVRSVVRPPEAAHETTWQAALLGLKGP